MLREAARIVAESPLYLGVYTTVLEVTRTGYEPAWQALDDLFADDILTPDDETGRSVRVIALLLTAEAVLTGDCE